MVIVAMGASAGGLEAFSEFFRQMPTDSGLAFVLVQHLDPNHESIMPELLTKETKMEVRQVQDEMELEPNHIYVIPPNATMRIEDGILRLAKPIEPRGRRMAIDTFFQSLAEDCGHRAICIVLSGTGSDGTQGLRAIKERGGLAIAQSAESARYDSMPRSAINTRLVDCVVSITEMPGLVLDYAKHLQEHPGEPVDSAECEEHHQKDGDELRRIFHALLRRTGHDFSSYKKGTLMRRIQRRMRVVQVDTLSDYADRLLAESAEAEELFNDLLISVTQFFRERPAFDTLERLVLPLIFAGHDIDSHVRIWVPGCATGEEAYTIAMLAAEQMQKMESPPKVQIFASDIDEHALETARAGKYPETIEAQVPPEYLRKYFTFEGNSYAVVKELREMCLFSVHNLIKDPPFSSLDLISCRNLLIYFESDLQKRLARLFHYALRPGGYLMLGPSENVASAPDLFRPVEQRHRVFQTKPTAIRVPVSFPLTRGENDELQQALEPEGLRITREQATMRSLERVLLESFAPASVVINESAEIAYIIGRCGKFLEPGVGAPSNKLVEMAREGLRLPLRTAIFRAVKSREEIVHDRLKMEADGVERSVRLTVRPLRELSGEHDLFIVIFQELHDPGQAVQDMVAQASGDDTFARQLESELRHTREHLQATIEELETSNEELKSSNEELLSMNEELQSSNEEMQTSKEELQSVNEELETVNTELHKKIEELDRANSDLQNLFQSTQIATIFLDNELRIQRFTPAATQVFRIQATDIGREIQDFAPRFGGVDVASEVEEVLRTLMPRGRQVQTADEHRFFAMRITPYRTTANVIAGVVITFVDITDLTRAQRERSRLAKIIDSSQDSVIGKDFNGFITSWNAAAERLFGYTAVEMEGQNIRAIIPPEHWEVWEQTLERLRRGEKVDPVDAVRVRKDGRKVDLQLAYSLIFDETGQPAGVSSISRDVSALKRAEAEAVRRAAEVQAIMEAVPAIVWIAEDREGKSIKGNRESYRFLRIPEGHNQSLTGGTGDRPTHFRVTKDGKELPDSELPVQRVCRTGQSIEGWQNEVVFDDGETRTIFGNIVPLIGQDGRPAGSVAAFIDVTEFQKSQTARMEISQELEKRVVELESARHESERANSAKDRFIAILSHELRTPLTPVLAAAQVVARENETLPESTRELLALIERNVLLETKLIDDLLDLNRLSFGKMTLDRRAVELASCVADAIQICREESQAKQVKVTSDVSTSLWVDGDPSRMRQIIWNLLRNAIRYSPTGSEICVRGSRASRTEARLEVRDHGCGISPDRLSSIFEPFERGAEATSANHGGLGLGLAICKALVELHGGSISAHSKGSDQGAVFAVTLPLTNAPEIDPARTELDETDIREFAGKRLLLVEDHHDTSRAMKRLLEKYGLVVTTASTVKEALAIASSQSFDMLLSDLGLPDGHGSELIEQIRKTNQTLPAIALSGFGMDHDVKHALHSGFDRHLTKPVEIVKLEQAIFSLLKK